MVNHLALDVERFWFGAVIAGERLRERSITLALVVALAVLIGQSPWWSTVLVAGLAAAVLALTQRGRVRVVRHSVARPRPGTRGLVRHPVDLA